jgi:hypothetical protein
MGSASGYEEEAPVHEVEVSRFAIDTYPVTNRDYVRFCEETGRPLPAVPNWQDMPDYIERFPDHPVVNVHYRDAAAYAAWAGKRLPTEAEWEYAARGGREDRTYPWGDEVPGNERAQYATRDTEFPWREFRCSTGIARTAPVGSFPANDFGVHDMAGNVWEWCSNWFYSYPWQDLDAGTIGEGWGLTRVVRGGAFHSPVEDLRVSRRLRVHGGVGGNGTGFRCAMDLEAEPLLTAPNLPEPAEVIPGAFDDVIRKHARHLASDVELCLGCEPDLSEEQAARVAALGFTSVEQYVHWGTVEGAGEGQFDFSHWDRQVEILRAHGLKWVPFLIAGPAYSLPQWFLHSSEHHGAVCREHRLESKIQSIFDRGFDRHIQRFLAAFAERYRDSGIIESLLLGITGDFGEAIYPVTGTAWTQVEPGPYHTHPGYWCADPLAEAQFREAMHARYERDLTRLNRAWDTSYEDVNEIAMPPLTIPDGIEAFRADEPTAPGRMLHQSAPERRRVLDFLDWYRAAMNDLAAFWMKTARGLFPQTPIYLCTGGDAPPQQGAHFGQQCRVAATVNGGVRITNEASNYARNFAITRWVTSAGRFYGAYTGIEPAGGVNDLGVTCRIYNASASGAKNLHFYAANIMHHAETIDTWEQQFSNIATETPIVTTALLYADTSVMLGLVATSAVVSQVAKLRDVTDFDYVDDGMVEAGALENYVVLVLTESPVLEAATLDRIDAWMAQGGLVIMLGDTPIETVEGEKWQPRRSDQVLRVGAFGEDEEANTSEARKMGAWLKDRGQPLIDGELDGLYMAKVEGKILVLNHTREAISRNIAIPGHHTSPYTFPANSISAIETG